MSELFLPMLMSGLADAAIIFFVAVGLTLVFSVLRVLNVAHGSFYSIGAYIAVTFGLWIVGTGWIPAYYTLPALLLSSAFVAALFGPLIERTLVRWTYDKTEAVQILVTFALFLILADLQRLVFGVNSYHETTPIQILGMTEVGGFIYPTYNLVLIGLAIAIVVGLRILLRRTRFGKLMLAVVEDREVSLSIGINIDRVFGAAFTLGVFLAALGGALASPTSGVSPGLGAETVVLAFAVAAIGGLGQIEGAAVAAVIVGIARSGAVFYFPALQSVAPYLAMLIILLIRPYGLFGSAHARRI